MLRSLTTFAGGVAALAVALMMPVSAQGLDRWSGFYIGAHGGSARTNASWENIDLTSERMEFSRRGFAGGGHLGLQQQLGSIVAGFELGYSALNAGADVVSPLTPAVTYSSELKNLITVTGRLGFAANQWLLYAKGGWASASVGYKGVEALIPDSFSLSERATGWVLGGGVEYQLTSNLVLGLDYTRIDLKERSFTGATRTAIPFTLDRAKTDTGLLMARISYKIGWPARGDAAPLK